MALPPAVAPEPPRQGFRHRLGTKLLMFALLLWAVAGGAGGLIYVALGRAEEDVLTPSPALPQRMVILSLAGLLNAGSSVGMWSFRRWGVYGVVCTSLVAFMVNWKIGGVPVAVPGLIGAICVAIFAMAAWVEFD